MLYTASDDLRDHASCITVAANKMSINYLWSRCHKLTHGFKSQVLRISQRKFSVKNNNFVGNILQIKFYTCCFILLSGTRPKRRYTHTYLQRGFASLGATGRLLPKPRCF